MPKPKLTVIEGGLSEKRTHEVFNGFALIEEQLIDTRYSILDQVDPSWHGKTVNGVTYGYKDGIGSREPVFVEGDSFDFSNN